MTDSRGRIIDMKTRIAKYDEDYLMEEKVANWNAITEIDEESIRLREEIFTQYQALQDVVKFGDMYGVDIRRTAMNTKESI